MARNVIYADSAETVAEVRRLLEAHGIKVGRASAEADAAAAVEHGEARLVIVTTATEGEAAERARRKAKRRYKSRKQPKLGGRARLALRQRMGAESTVGPSPKAPGPARSQQGPAGEPAWTWQDDDAAYERRLPELMVRYEGRFVAMYRGEVVGVADDAKSAARQGLAALGRPAALFVAEVGAPRPEPLETGMWMGAPRSVDYE